MRICFLFRREFWKNRGGDIAVLLSLCRSLKKLGHEINIVIDPLKMGDFDHLFLYNTSWDHRPMHTLLKLHGINYGLIGFHEDREKYCTPRDRFFHYVRSGEAVEKLLENPELIHDSPLPPHKLHTYKYEILEKAEPLIASCKTEAAIMRRDSPGCNPKVVHWSSEKGSDPTDAFLKMTGLASGEYILQVGRFEGRKNQLASILATKDLAMPLVFIAAMTMDIGYEQLVLETIFRYRKAPTFILSQVIPTAIVGPLRILQMPKGKQLSLEIVLSAHRHAGLYLHPAFYELPGLVYLEAARFGIPTVASSWTTISDYFTDSSGIYTLDKRIEYATPYDLPQIRALVEKKFGQKYPEGEHPAFYRTSLDTAREFLRYIPQA